MTQVVEGTEKDEPGTPRDLETIEAELRALLGEVPPERVEFLKLQEASEAELRRRFDRLRRAYLREAKRRGEQEQVRRLSNEDFHGLLVFGESVGHWSGKTHRYRLVRAWCTDCDGDAYYVSEAEKQPEHVRCERCAAAHREKVREAATDRLRARRAERAGPIVDLRCEHCGERFEPQTRAKRSRYCSNACRQAAYRARRG